MHDVGEQVQTLSKVFQEQVEILSPKLLIADRIVTSPRLHPVYK